MSIYYDSSSNISNLAIEEPSIPFPLPTQRDLYRSENNCEICKCKLNVLGLAHTIKHHCNFCYHATCSRCLSFDYYHPETKSIQLMCRLCYHKISSISEEFKNLLSKYLFERKELKKEIQLAIEEKKIYSQERQKILEKLRVLKQSFSLTSTQQKEEFEEQKRKNLNFLKQIEQKKLAIKDESFKEGILQKNFSFFKSKFSGFKKEKEFEYKYCERLREELNSITAKISIINKETNNGETREDKNKEIFTEIKEISENILKEKSKTKVLKTFLVEVLKNIKNNQEIIEKIMTQLTAIKKEEFLSKVEETRLKEIKKQLSDTNDLVRIVSERRDSVKLDYNRKSNIPDFEYSEPRTEEVFKPRLTYHPNIHLSITEDDSQSSAERSSKESILNRGQSLRSSQIKIIKDGKTREKSRENLSKKRDCVLCDESCSIS